ncbi:hypothetical protein IAU59_002664 [Kwoniella sp. CBS 9459]
MSSVARPIAFSRNSYSSPPSSPSSRPSELSSSPTSAAGPAQHPCPHLSEFVQQIVKAYYGPRDQRPITSISTRR